MGPHDYEEESSDSDHDDGLRVDIEELSRAFSPTTNTTFDTENKNNSYYDEEEKEDDDEDLEMLRSIKARYGEPLNLEPLTQLPPADYDDEDGDLEIIQRCYSQYGAAATAAASNLVSPGGDNDDDDLEMLRAIQRRYSRTDGDVANSAITAGDIDETKIKDASYADKPFSNSATDLSLWSEALEVYRDNVEPGSFDDAEKEEVSTSPSSFPRVARTFIEAIKKNRAFQKFIRSRLLHIEARMEEIKEVRKRLKTLRDFQVQCKKKIGRALSQKQDARIQLISIPKQRAKGVEKNASVMCYGPIENSYVASYKAALEKFPLSFYREKWSQDEMQSLEKGMVQHYQEMLLQKSAAALSNPGQPCSDDGVDGMILSIRNHDITPEIIQHFLDNVDWNHLACLHLPRRSGEECEARWLNYENRLINQDKWTTDEDKRLLLLIQQNGIHNWSCVANLLDTNRTPYQCLARYQRSLNASILKREWTEDEDAQLRFAVESFGESNWQAVASVLEGRTGTQCSNRWKKTLHPARERVGRWSADEDKRLRVAVILFGKSWHRISQFVPGRTQVQCRERWVNVLDPSLNRGDWTEEDDSKLKAAIIEHGYCWTKVAACVPLRTDNQCRRRWKRLFPHEVPLLKAARSIQKAALISNFVDRESNRPVLGPKDFVPLPIEGPPNDQENDNGRQNQEKPRRRKRRDTSQIQQLTPSCNLRGTRARKRKRSATSANSKKTEDCAAAGNSYWNDITESVKTTRKSGSKKKKQCPRKTKNKSCECRESVETSHIESCNSKEPDEASETDSWDVPIRIRSRRARCIQSKASGVPDVVSYVEQNEPSTFSESHLKMWDDKEIEMPDMEAMARKPIISKLLPQITLIETSRRLGNFMAKELGRSSNSLETHCADISGSNTMNTKKQRRKSTLRDVQVKEWEDLPLSILFNEALTCKQREKLEHSVA